MAQGRAKQLEIVFVNLIKNAAEAMSNLEENRERKLHIGASFNQREIIMSVKDTGPGIKPEDMGKILSPNFTTKGPHGTGIGLYLSRQIILAHGGTIEVASPNGNGATFTIKLPR